MTALLKPDEHLTLGVNVIVRPGDMWHDSLICDAAVVEPHICKAVSAPQDWVALTGACPQPSAAYAMTICSRCGHMRLSWDSPCHCPVTVPMVSWIGSCDWGSCNQPTARWRFDDDAGWLPVCAEHGRRIVPLYRQCPACRGTGAINRDHLGWTPGLCGNCEPPTEPYAWASGRVLVGRGSIEVVPIVDGWGHPPSLDESPKCLVFAPPYAILELVREYQPLILAFGDKRLNLPTFDPLPVPGRDFGIVIDCVELAS